MESATEALLKTIDQNMLKSPVRQALNHDTAEVVDWQFNQLSGASTNSEIFRFTGHARDKDEALPWSLILKIIRSPDGEDDPTSMRYWKREALVYESDFVSQLPGGLRAPRCYGIVKQPGLEVWLWLEEIKDESNGRWSLERFGETARHLGEFNGLCFDKPDLLAPLWLTKNHLRAWVGNDAPIISDNVRAHPLVARYIPPDIYAWMQQVWSEHKAWIEFIERQPQTLAHLDAFTRNIFSRRAPRGDLQTVMIDWAFVGNAAAGEEIVPLVFGSLNFLDADIAQARALEKTVFENYLDGLRATGWHGDPLAVRFTYAATAVLKFSIGVYGVAFMVADESQHPLLKQIFGHPVEELVEVWAQTLRLLYNLSQEARGLLDTLQ